MADHEWQNERGQRYRKSADAKCCDQGPFCEDEPACEAEQLVRVLPTWDHELGEPEPKPEVEQLLDDADPNMPNAGRETPAAPWVTCLPDTTGRCANPAHGHEPMDESARAREVERIMRRRGGHWPEAARYVDPAGEQTGRRPTGDGKCPNPGCDVPWHGHVDLGPAVEQPTTVIGGLGNLIATPRTDLVVQITLAGREPLEVTVPFQPDDRGPLVATSLVLRVAGMPIVAVPFSDHGAGLHTICSRTPGAEDDPAADQIGTVVTQ